MKTALITGAYKGLGLEWCRQLGKRGYKVILTARNLDKARAAADRLCGEGLNVSPMAVDVADEAQIADLAVRVKSVCKHLDVLVNNAGINSFAQASVANAKSSRADPGIARFEVLQSETDPTAFILTEIYRSPRARIQHKETAHFKTWQKTVADMMATPRRAVTYRRIFPT